jgi:hypothetical protein
MRVVPYFAGKMALRLWLGKCARLLYPEKITFL